MYQLSVKCKPNYCSSQYQCLIPLFDLVSFMDILYYLLTPKTFQMAIALHNQHSFPWSHGVVSTACPSLFISFRIENPWFTVFITFKMPRYLLIDLFQHNHLSASNVNWNLFFTYSLSKLNRTKPMLKKGERWNVTGLRLTARVYSKVYRIT